MLNTTLGLLRPAGMSRSPGAMRLIQSS